MTTDLVRTDDDTQHGLAVADREQASAALAHVLGTGDLYQLTNEQRVAHYLNLCTSLGLNPLSRPFQWIEFKEGENAPAVLTLYFKPSGAAQLLRNHQVSVHFPRKEIVGELFVVEAHGQAPNGRTGQATKYVPLTNRYGKLTGNRLANAFMSAESGALRRLALNMFGLSTGADPDELTAVRVVTVDGTGQVLDHPTPEQKMLAENPAAARVIGEPTYEDMGIAPSDLPTQRVRPDELERPAAPSGPRPSFKNSDEQIATWRSAWFAMVKGLSLDTDAARAAFIAQWTADEWPKAKRTDSLATFLARATPTEAEALLSHVRALMDDERRELLEQSHANMPDPETARPRPDVDRRVHDAVMVTGGPLTVDDELAPAF